MKVQLVTPYRVRPLQRYSVTVCGNVTSVYLPLSALLLHQPAKQYINVNLCPCRDELKCVSVTYFSKFYNTFRILHKIYSTCILINNNVLIIYYLGLHRQKLKTEINGYNELR